MISKTDRDMPRA